MIKVEGISKKFKLYRSPADRLKEILFRKQYHKDFVAPGNISLRDWRRPDARDHRAEPYHPFRSNLYDSISIPFIKHDRNER